MTCYLWKRILAESAGFVHVRCSKGNGQISASGGSGRGGGSGGRISINSMRIDGVTVSYHGESSFTGINKIYVSRKAISVSHYVSFEYRGYFVFLAVFNLYFANLALILLERPSGSSRCIVREF